MVEYFLQTTCYKRIAVKDMCDRYARTMGLKYCYSSSPFFQSSSLPIFPGQRICCIPTTPTPLVAILLAPPLPPRKLNLEIRGECGREGDSARAREIEGLQGKSTEGQVGGSCSFLPDLSPR